MAIAAVLDDSSQTWIIKGGVALEMRREGTARATRDLDLIFNAVTEDLVATIEESIKRPYGKFTFRRTGAATRLHEANTWRIDIAVRFNGSDWTTVSVDITPRETFGVEYRVGGRTGDAESIWHTGAIKTAMSLTAFSHRSKTAWDDRAGHTRTSQRTCP